METVTTVLKTIGSIISGLITLIPIILVVSFWVLVGAAAFKYVFGG